MKKAHLSWTEQIAFDETAWKTASEATELDVLMMFYRYLHVKLRTEGISETNLKKHIRAAEGENYKTISPISVAYVAWTRQRETTYRKRRLEAEEQAKKEEAKSGQGK